MTIRPITEEDIPTVVEMMLLNWDQVMSNYHSVAVVKKFMDEVTPAWLTRQMGWKQIWVVEEAGEVIATGALADFGSPEAPKLSVSQFFVRPEVHGRGIGKYLMTHLVQMARGEGCARLYVPSSRNAIHFYTSAGFTMEAEQPDAADEITWMSAGMKGSADHATPGDAMPRT
jgi:GNAT superfamily N-acetyltransferase